MHLKSGPDGLEITPESAGWEYVGLTVREHDAATPVELRTDGVELCILPLAGSGTVEVDGQTVRLAGRESPFASTTDFLYVPVGSELRATLDGRFAFATSRASTRLALHHGAAAEVPVEIRGAGPATRQVNNFLAPGVVEAEHLVCVELLTPEGNWSSYPPHKHDTDDAPGRSPEEAVLEEVYYFEVAGEGGFGIHRTYTPDRAVDDTIVVHDQDAYLIPRGYHGPCIAAPGHDLYYLNVLAGPGAPSLAFSDDPAHHWLRAAWETMERDPRVPMTGAPTT
jgi:5-deoxy-glucuronate isomerase